MTLVNGGLAAISCALGGDVVGYSGTATACTATSLTATGTPWTASTFIGHIVVATTASLMYGVITANTTSGLTVDQWYSPSSPGGAAVGPPSNTTAFCILPGNAPYWYMAVNNGTHVIGPTDTVLTGEITTANGGLLRVLATYAYTTNNTYYTLSNTFTANSNDVGSLPYAVNNIGIFNTRTPSTGRMLFETALNAVATLAASGDNVSITETVNI